MTRKNNRECHEQHTDYEKVKKKKLLILTIFNGFFVVGDTEETEEQMEEKMGEIPVFDFPCIMPEDQSDTQSSSSEEDEK